MTDSPDSAAGAQSAAPIHPKLTAEQALTRLLELIRTTPSVSDLSSERASQVMGVDMGFASNKSGEYGFGEQITPEWLQNFGTVGGTKIFEFTFDPVRPGTTPNMTEICHLDFDMFSDALVSMGFTKTPYYVEHGRLMNYTYDRMRDGLLEMRIDVYPEGEHVWNEKNGSGRICVKMIQIY